MSSTSGMIVYLVFIIAIFYFMAIRPQSKEKKKQAELMATVAVRRQRSDIQRLLRRDYRYDR